MQSKLITVDLSDNEIGSETKLFVHENSVLHRAFSVFIVSGNKMLLQKRAMDKYHSGGLWTNACCSHPRYGEELHTAVERRLIDELNIKCSVEEIGSFVYFAEFEKVCEYEYDHVFLGAYNGLIEPNPEEISEIKWMNIEAVQKDILENPAVYTKWFVTALPMVIKHINNSGV
jgi:isopentenyl-diphosphate delta-isomerase